MGGTLLLSPGLRVDGLDGGGASVGDLEAEVSADVQLLADERGDDLRPPVVLDAADVLHLVDQVLDGGEPVLEGQLLPHPLDVRIDDQADEVDEHAPLLPLLGPGRVAVVAHRPLHVGEVLLLLVAQTIGVPHPRRIQLLPVREQDDVAHRPPLGGDALLVPLVGGHPIVLVEGDLPMGAVPLEVGGLVDHRLLLREVLEQQLLLPDLGVQLHLLVRPAHRVVVDVGLQRRGELALAVLVLPPVGDLPLHLVELALGVDPHPDRPVLYPRDQF